MDEEMPGLSVHKGAETVDWKCLKENCPYPPRQECHIGYRSGHWV